LVTLITPLTILIPSPAVNLSYLLDKAEFMLFSASFKASILLALLPVIFKAILRTLSKVVIPYPSIKDMSSVFTTTASANVIGTNSLEF
jgi:hypothetical protein